MREKLPSYTLGAEAGEHFYGFLYAFLERARPECVVNYTCRTQARAPFSGARARRRKMFVSRVRDERPPCRKRSLYGRNEKCAN
jgi:hypothetical protein